MKSKSPWDMPRLAANALITCGLALALVATLLPWYLVPFGEDGQLYWEKSVFEYPAKMIFAGFAIVIMRCWSAESLVVTGLAGMFAGLLFCHFTICNDVSIGRQAASVLEGYDGLTWFGGDIYTGREYEYAGGETLSLKDQPLFLQILPMPYSKLDVASCRDFFEWCGLGPTFWTFLRKGWALFMIASVFIIVGGLAHRKVGRKRGLSPRPLDCLLRYGAVFSVVFLSLVFGRVFVTSALISEARKAGDSGDFEKAVSRLEYARFVLPALNADTGMIFQLGRYASRIDGNNSVEAELYRAFSLESSGHDKLAEGIYQKLQKNPRDHIRQESMRGLTRLAIDAYNSGRKHDSRRLFRQILRTNSALPKQRYASLLLHIGSGSYGGGEKDLVLLKEVFSGIQMKRSRGVVASGRQHLAQLAFDQGRAEEAWQQFTYRTGGE